MATTVYTSWASSPKFCLIVFFQKGKKIYCLANHNQKLRDEWDSIMEFQDDGIISWYGIDWPIDPMEYDSQGQPIKATIDRIEEKSMSDEKARLFWNYLVRNGFEQEETGKR